MKLKKSLKFQCFLALIFNFSCTPGRLEWNTRIIDQRNYRKRNNWKLEHAHNTVNKHTHSRRRQTFPIAEADVQRYDFFPQSFVFPVHPEPIDHRRSDGNLYLPYKRDPTVSDQHLDNYCKFYCSEDMTEYEFIEYMKTIYDVEILNVEMERVEEQTVQMFSIPKSILESDKTVVEIDTNKIGFNDRLKIAHALLEHPFKFPDFKTEQGRDEEKTVEFEKSDLEDAKEYLELVKKELQNVENKKEGDVKRRYYEKTVSWVHGVLEDDMKNECDKQAEVYKNVQGLVRGAAGDKGAAAQGEKKLSKI